MASTLAGSAALGGGNRRPTLAGPFKPSSIGLLDHRRYGVLGGGVSGCGAARLLAALGREVLLFDDRDLSTEQGIDELAALGVRTCWGRPEPDGATAALGGVEALIVSPGVPGDHPLRREAFSSGLPVAGEVELAWLCSGAATVAAITGTNGKTTVTMLVRHLAEAAGLRAVETGNIGAAFSASVLEAGPERDRTLFVVEISSFQLEDARDFAPRIAVILNITPDHLDRHSDMARYAAAKARITARQGPEDVLVLNQDDALCLSVGQGSRARLLHFSTERAVEAGAWLDDDQLVLLPEAGGAPRRLTDLERLPLIGMHNVANALAAACVASALGVERKTIGRALESFHGAPHRLEWVGAIHGVDYVNDSKATNLDALAKAVASFSAPIHLIAGGRDKAAPFSLYLPRIAPSVSRVYLIGEAGETIARAWEGGVACERCGTLERALEAASARAVPGDVVLLAPGCASFDQFTSYAHRGEVFRNWVRERLEPKGRRGDA